ncbi:MAG: flippase-like domain-containing protein [Defluviitaleaceae bacterium]|nr:flippase-like domain-containing protein [Defluviitaleaceae bacterium]
MKKNIGILLKLFIAIFLLGYILLTHDISKIISHLLNIPLLLWGFVFLLMVVQVIISVVVFMLFMPNQTFLSLLYVRLVSFAYGFILPGQLATEGVRAYLLGKDEKSFGQSSAAVALNKIITVIVLLFLGTVGLIFAGSLGYILIYVFVIAGIVLTLMLFSLASLFFYNRINRLLLFLSQRVAGFGKFFNVLAQMAEHWHGYTRNIGLMVKVFLFVLLFQLSVAIIGVILSYGVGAEASFLEWLWINSVLTFVLILPISLGGIGIREGSLIGLLGQIGVEPEQALAVSFGFLALTIIQALAGIGMEIGLMINKKEGGH